MKPLSGREASVLALLAQSQSLSATEKRHILSALDGRALEIARVMVGAAKCASGAVLLAADGFTAWARGLPGGSR